MDIVLKSIILSLIYKNIEMTILDLEIILFILKGIIMAHQHHVLYLVYEESSFHLLLMQIFFYV